MRDRPITTFVSTVGLLIIGCSSTPPTETSISERDDAPLETAIDGQPAGGVAVHYDGTINDDTNLLLRVDVGALPDGSRMNIYSSDGELIGAISPYVQRLGDESGTHTLALKKSLLSDDPTAHLLFRVFVTGETDARAPTKSELKSVTLVAQ